MHEKEKTYTHAGDFYLYALIFIVSGATVSSIAFLAADWLRSIGAMMTVAGGQAAVQSPLNRENKIPPAVNKSTALIVAAYIKRFAAIMCPGAGCCRGSPMVALRTSSPL